MARRIVRVLMPNNLDASEIETRTDLSEADWGGEIVFGEAVMYPLCEELLYLSTIAWTKIHFHTKTLDSTRFLSYDRSTLVVYFFAGILCWWRVSVG